MSTNKLEQERLQKFLAKYGVASRRKIEELIKGGEITVNGKVAELGCRVDTNSNIVISGKKFIVPNNFDQNQQQDTRLILYNKPVGKICSKTDPDGRETVYQDLPKLKNSRWISVGRLDINTSGLLLFTNNGELANKLMHPSNNYEREYLVRVLGEVSDASLTKLLRGVQLEDGMAKFKKIKVLKTSNAANNWFKVVLTEGRKREVRRLWEAVGCKVSRLTRVRFGPYELPRDLHHGCYINIDVIL